MVTKKLVVLNAYVRKDERLRISNIKLGKEQIKV